MDAISALTNRVSIAKLEQPGPTPEQWQILLNAALRAADHGQLRPWRFLTIEGEAREALGKLYCQAALAADESLSSGQQQKFEAMPMRAPAVLVIIASCKPHPKVPKQEQIISAGAAAQNIINAAFALGLGAMWRTGDMAYSEQVRQGLGLTADEELIGYIYLGSPAGAKSLPSLPSLEELCQPWHGDTL